MFNPRFQTEICQANQEKMRLKWYNMGVNKQAREDAPDTRVSRGGKSGQLKTG